ncbi:MAG: hypothetical protein GY719_12620 [bacterium]|nr:hypothetical protein [bacterium]
MSLGTIGRSLLCLVPFAAVAVGQEEGAAREEPVREEAVTVLGQPAGWSVEDATTLIDLAEDSALYLEPDSEATVLALLPEVRLPLLESRENWVKVRFGDRVGWVDLEAPRLPRDPDTPRPRLPPKIQIVPPESEPLDLGPEWAQKQLGPYTLHTQIDDRRLIEDLATVARQHASLYAKRYGLPVEDDVTGSVVLFGGERAFLEFQRARGHEVREADTAGYFRTPDLVVLYRGSHSRQKLTAVLLHELTHLVSFRLLRNEGRLIDRLPKWLDEGMANDLSMASLDRRGELRGGPLGPANLLFGRRLGVLLLQTEYKMVEAGTAPSWEKLLAMDKKAFFGGDIETHYLMSSFLVRYLLDEDPEQAAAFHGYLANVASGGDMRPEELMSRLDLDWQQLSSGFRRWLLRQKVRFGV